MMTYIYVPTTDFNAISSEVEKLYPEINCDGGFCNFDKSCADSITTYGRGLRNHTMSFDIADQNGDSVFKDILDLDHFFIPGEQLDLHKDLCYFAIIRNTEANDQDKWFFGQILMQEYYFSFDMTPSDER